MFLIFCGIQPCLKTIEQESGDESINDDRFVRSYFSLSLLFSLSSLSLFYPLSLISILSPSLYSIFFPLSLSFSSFFFLHPFQTFPFLLIKELSVKDWLLSLNDWLLKQFKWPSKIGLDDDEEDDGEIKRCTHPHLLQGGRTKRRNFRSEGWKDSPPLIHDFTPCFQQRNYLEENN